MLELDVAGQITPPTISPEGLAHYRELLARPGFEQENPTLFAMIRDTVSTALQVTGQELDPNPDQRTPAQRHFDTSYAMQISDVLRDAVLRDSKANSDPPNPEKAKKAFAGVGISYADALRDAQHAVAVSRDLAGVKVERLPPETLAQLAVFGQHHRKWSAKRPQ